MQQIEENDVAGSSDRLADIALQKFNVSISPPRHVSGALDLASVAVEAADLGKKVSLAQIEREQPDAAAEIDQRLVRIPKQRKGRGKNRIAPQFAARVNAQPSLGKPGRHPCAGRLWAAAPRHFPLRGFPALTN